jgi:hypothetical protein
MPDSFQDVFPYVSWGVEMIERGTFNVVDAESNEAGVVNLSSADDMRWAGVIVLRPTETFALSHEARYDLYVLSGSVGIDGAEPMHRGAFASRCDAKALQAGEEGASVFVYREQLSEHCHEVTQSAADRAWHNARAAGMHVAALSNAGHRLTLVEWEPGARTREHDHPYGEEIFVLSGELRSQDERYPAGTWLRLHPGSRHEPFAEIPTVILLRNGHLEGADRAGDV